MPSILFFLGILMAVAVLQSTGIFGTSQPAEWLDREVHNIYVINILLGALSSVVDNVPLVAAAMGMYPIADPGRTRVSVHISWSTAHSGSSSPTAPVWEAAFSSSARLPESSPWDWKESVSAGILKHISWLALLLGYLAGAVVYIAEAEWLKPLLDA